jgi:hypothetical protein
MKTLQKDMQLAEAVKAIGQCLNLNFRGVGGLVGSKTAQTDTIPGLGLAAKIC